MMKRHTKILWIAGGILMFVGILCSVIFSMFSYRQSQELTKMIQENVLMEEEDVKEDDVKIAGEYYVRSTLPISDAYKNGDTSELDDKQKETLDMASKVLEEIITENMTEYEKELAVFDWMRDNLASDRGVLTVIPTSKKDSENPYGVLKYHNAVCVGYATTFRLFMQMMDIPCMVVHNSDRFHTWNLVEIDGSWYHVDIYSSMDCQNYSYFNMNDEICMKNQEWNSFFPSATDLTYNMAYRQAKKGCNVYKIPEKIRKCLDEGDDCLSMLYDREFTEEQAAITMQIFSSLEEKLRCYEDYMNCGLTYYFTQVKEGYLLVVYMNYYDETGTENLITDEENEKIMTTIEETFADLDARSFEEDPTEYEDYDEYSGYEKYEP